MQAYLALVVLAVAAYTGVDAEAVVSLIINPSDKSPPDNSAEEGGKTTNGDKLVEGDMAVHGKDSGSVRNAIKNQNRKWPKDSQGNVIIPYVYDSSLSSAGRQAIEQSIADYNKYTCIRWVKRTNQQYYVSFFRGNGCWSYVGTTKSSPQQISLGYGCEYKGTATHEMMHCIGFDHEQTRPDRDQYVTINFHNIKSDNSYNFDFCKDCTTQNLPYDYSSVMHYGKTAFTKNGQDTITPKQRGVTLGQRKGLSEYDIKKINKLYQCGDTGGNNGGGAGCADRMDCSSYRNICNDQSYHDSMQYWCPKTCNKC